MGMRLIAAPCLALVVLLSPIALAQGQDAAAAESLFRDAKAAEQRGDYAAACGQFAESQRLDPAAGTLLNLADCEEHLGKTASAWEHYISVRDQLKPGDERLPYAQARIAALEGRLPRLALRLPPGAPAGTRVMRGQTEVGSASLGIPVVVDPGTVTVTVTSPGRLTTRLDVNVRDGESSDLVVQVGELEHVPSTPSQVAVMTALPPRTPPSPSPSGTRRTIGWIVGGVGAAGVVVGSITGAMALGAASTYKANCNAAGACRNSEGIDAAASGKTYATLSTVGFVVGAAGLGAGLYLVLSGGSSGSTTVGAAPMPGGGGLVLVRGF